MYAPKKLFWEEKYSVGEENLDFQHQYLFETFNKLGEAIAQEEGENSVGVILGRLKFYADWHFAREEECMARYHCPAAETNRRAHEAFREIFAAYYEEYASGGGSKELARRIHESLSDWLENHILKVDSSLRDCTHSSK